MNTVEFRLAGDRSHFFLHTQDQQTQLLWLDRLRAGPFHRGLGIVGSRRAASWSQAFLQKTLRQLPKNSGITVISGLAHGVDRWAHAQALLQNLPTLAVVPAFDLRNSDLEREILESGGAIVALKEPHAVVYKSDFLKRNRWIAWWSSAVWVVEAPIPSGALNTAKWARDFGRAVFATPCRPEDPDFAGNAQLLSRDCAIPFWGIDSLGWDLQSDLGQQMSFLSSKSVGSENLFSSPEALWLAEKTDYLTRKNGSVDLLSLADAFAAQFPTTESFFEWIEQWKNVGWISLCGPSAIRAGEQLSRELKRCATEGLTKTV